MKRFAPLAIVLALTACGGRTAMPVASYQYGDEDKPCDTLRAEMAEIETKVAALMPKTQKTGKNVALGVAGAWLIVPWFFMDFTDSERIEVQAYQDRARTLNAIMVRKQCAGAATPPPTHAEK